MLSSFCLTEAGTVIQLGDTSELADAIRAEWATLKAANDEVGTPTLRNNAAKAPQ